MCLSLLAIGFRLSRKQDLRIGEGRMALDALDFRRLDAQSPLREVCLATE